MISVLMRLAILAPIKEKIKAVKVAGRVARQSMPTCLAYCTTAKDVPAMEASLFVPRRFATGTWGRKISKAGSWMSPPPPATESMKPARKAKPHKNTISKTQGPSLSFESMVLS
jgi:hypothetical protein